MRSTAVLQLLPNIIQDNNQTVQDRLIDKSERIDAESSLRQVLVCGKLQRFRNHSIVLLHGLDALAYCIIRPVVNESLKLHHFNPSKHYPNPVEQKYDDLIDTGALVSSYMRCLTFNLIISNNLRSKINTSRLFSTFRESARTKNLNSSG